MIKLTLDPATHMYQRPEWELQILFLQMHISRIRHIYKIHKRIHICYEAKFNHAKSDLSLKGLQICIGIKICTSFN